MLRKSRPRYVVVLETNLVSNFGPVTNFSGPYSNESSTVGLNGQKHRNYFPKNEYRPRHSQVNERSQDPLRDIQNMNQRSTNSCDRANSNKIKMKSLFLNFSEEFDSQLSLTILCSLKQFTVCK